MRRDSHRQNGALSQIKGSGPLGEKLGVGRHEFGQRAIEPAATSGEAEHFVAGPESGHAGADGFHDACARTGLPPERLAMVGDTLHTDVLGGRAAGMGAVLVADHGLFAGRDVRGYIARSGIVPDAVVATT